MNKTHFGALLGALVMVLGCAGCVADGSYYGGGPGYYGGGYGPGYYGGPAAVVVGGAPVYRETVVVGDRRPYRYRDGYYNRRRPAPYYSGSRRGGYSGRPSFVNGRRGPSRRAPATVYHRGNNKKRQDHR